MSTSAEPSVGSKSELKSESALVLLDKLLEIGIEDSRVNALRALFVLVEVYAGPNLFRFYDGIGPVQVRDYMDSLGFSNPSGDMLLATAAIRSGWVHAKSVGDSSTIRLVEGVIGREEALRMCLRRWMVEPIGELSRQWARHGHKRVLGRGSGSDMSHRGVYAYRWLYDTDVIGYPSPRFARRTLRKATTMLDSGSLFVDPAAPRADGSRSWPQIQPWGPRLRPTLMDDTEAKASFLREIELFSR